MSWKRFRSWLWPSEKAEPVPAESNWEKMKRLTDELNECLSIAHKSPDGGSIRPFYVTRDYRSGTPAHLVLGRWSSRGIHGVEFETLHDTYVKEDYQK